MREGWGIKKLGDISKIVYGYTEKASLEEIGPKFLRITDIEDNGVNWHTVPYCKISPLEYDKYKLVNGDIVFARTGATTGKSFLVKNPPKSVFASYLIKLNVNKEIFLPEFLLLFFQTDTYWNIINDGISGSAQGGFNATKLGNLSISLPSLEVQRSIILIIQSAFSIIDQAKSNTQKNLQNTKDLFESYLQSVFENKGEGWEEKTLGEIAQVKSGGTPSRSKKEYWEGDIAWYSSGELNNLYTTEPERYINELAINNSNSKLFPKGSLLIGMYDTAALKMSILDRDGTFNQAIAGVKPNEKIDLYFILHSINAIKPELLSMRRGVRQKNLSLEKIKNIPIFLPPLTEQKALVQKLKVLSTQTKKLEAIYQKKLADLEELKKSILQKAFSGELTANEVAV
ncbi:MAG: restriction endonuclease subunit S [Opitutaceae bacterium]|nr:restriction endonuclease subunit S [Cytophagales bacterium]